MVIKFLKEICKVLALALFFYPCNALAKKDSKPSGTLLKDSFFQVGFVYMNSPVFTGDLDVDFTNNRDISSSEDMKYKNLSGISLGYNMYVNDNTFVGMQLELIKRSRNKFVVGNTGLNVDASIRPISLIANVGKTFSLPLNLHCRGFMGLGISYMDIDNDKTDVTSGLLYEFGLGFIANNFFIDLIFRSMSSSYETKHVKSSLDITFEPMVRIGGYF